MSPVAETSRDQLDQIGDIVAPEDEEDEDRDDEERQPEEGEHDED
jgi:hypothetical protein